MLTLLYRIAQLQVDNIAKHSNAKNVLMKVISFKDKMLMSIYDDGNGTDVNELKFGQGISTIQERIEAFGGEFNLVSAKGKKGFTLHVVI